MTSPGTVGGGVRARRAGRARGRDKTTGRGREAAAERIGGVGLGGVGGDWSSHRGAQRLVAAGTGRGRWRRDEFSTAARS